jgi:competence protein ComEA
MSALPTKRLLVYVATGAVILVAGVLGLVSMKGTTGGEGTLLFDTSARGAAGEAGLASAIDGRLLDPGGALLTTTTTTELPRIWVQVAGAVVRPGVYHVTIDTRVFQAIAEAGGITEEADEGAVAMAAALFDGCRVYVPRAGEVPAGTVVAPSASSAGVAGGTAGSSQGPISLNVATPEQLDALPGVGPALAAQIVAYRESRGPFTSVDQLTDVPGIGPAKLEQLRPLVRL